MPFEFNWHDPEHTIIRVDIYGAATWDESTFTTDRIVAEVAKATHRIDIIFNAQVDMPKGNPLPHLKAANRRLSVYKERLGLITTVGPRNISSVVRVMVDIMMRVYKLDRTHLGETVTTMDAALRNIEKSRAKDKKSASTN